MNYYDFLAHFGVSVKDGAPGRGSGRWPLGSGDDPQSYKNFLDKVKELEDSGYKPKDIAEYFDLKGKTGVYSTDVLKQVRRIATTEWKKYEYDQGMKLRSQGYNDTEIAKMMGWKSESTTRSKLNKQQLAKKGDMTEQAAIRLENRLDEIIKSGNGKYLQVGEGVEAQLGISEDRLKASLRMLQNKGYETINIQVPQLGTQGNQKTSVLVLAPKGTTYKEVKDNYSEIKNLEEYKPLFRKDLTPPASIDSSRVYINYTDENGKGGIERDGSIRIRPGVQDLSLGMANYAQVRIAVDDKYYLKGMAYYSNDVPKGYDIIFDTNKKVGTPMEDVFKKMKMHDGKIDLENPFGASVLEDYQLKKVPRYYTDEKGESHKSAINVVNEEGSWYSWKDKLSSQFLSKQFPAVAKQQLDLTAALYKSQLEDIKELSVPAVRRYELEEFASQCDASAADLKAIGFAGQKTRVILPFPSIKDGEIYDPNHKDGEQVALVRFPHEGTFQIAVCTVNNKNKDAKEVIKNSKDAVGINGNTANQMSGADFDGDTAVVIPLGNNKIKATGAIKELLEYDHKTEYAIPKELKIDYDYADSLPKDERKKYIAEQVKMGKIKRMEPREKGIQMGMASNLITDMTQQNAPEEDIIKAVRHSMMVIDSEKHYLDWRRSEQENDIALLRARYQGNPKGGASSLISKANATLRNYPKRKELKYITENMVENGKATPEEYERWKNGERVYRFTGETHKNYDPEKDEWYDSGKLKTEDVTRMDVVKDAFELASKVPTAMETIYGNYANKMKMLANEARKLARSTPKGTVDPELRKEYIDCYNSLKEKVVEAQKNKPLERQAQIVANTNYDALREKNPDWSSDDKKKWKGKLLTQARDLVGASKKKVDLSPRELEAIKKGAISDNMLNKVLQNSDRKKIKEQIMPRENKTTLSDAKLAFAKARLRAGMTQADVAEELGISVTTLNKYL